jgi:hypothetical protein
LRSITQVANELLERADAARVPRVLAHAVHRAKFGERLPACLGFAETALAKLRDHMLDVLLDFLVELAVESRPCDQHAKTAKELDHFVLPFRRVR